MGSSQSEEYIYEDKFETYAMPMLNMSAPPTCYPRVNHNYFFLQALLRALLIVMPFASISSHALSITDLNL